jgi:hypothetical protein
MQKFLSNFQTRKFKNDKEKEDGWNYMKEKNEMAGKEMHRD